MHNKAAPLGAAGDVRPPIGQPRVPVATTTKAAPVSGKLIQLQPTSPSAVAHRTPPPASKTAAPARRTKVPASLLWDLKLFAYYAGDPKLARELLVFDLGTRVVFRLGPLDYAEQLARVARRITRPARRHIDSIVDRLCDATIGTEDESKVAGNIMEMSERQQEIALLLRRLWRVVDGLMLAARRGVPVIHRGSTWFRSGADA